MPTQTIEDTMTDHTTEVTRLGYLVVLPTGDPATDPLTDDIAVYPTEDAAEDAAAELADLNAQWWHIPDWSTQVVRAADYTPAPRALPATSAERLDPPAPTRTTTIYAVLMPSGRLHVSAEDMAARRKYTHFSTEAEAEDTARRLATHAAGHGLRGLAPRVVSATITTTTSPWA